jgi:hypothetical protein
MPTIINPKNIYEYMGASYRINTNLQVQNSFYIPCKFIQTGSYGGYKASHANERLFSFKAALLGQFYKTIHKKETPIARGLFLFFQ